MGEVQKKKLKVCMVVQQPDVQGGIAAVTNGYYGSILEEDCNIRYVESYCNGSKFRMVMKALRAYAEFKKVLNDFQPDLIHIHSSFGGSFYRMQPFLYMAKKRGIPVVDHLHGADFGHFYEKASQAKKDRIRKVYGDFDRIIVLSDEWKDTMSRVVDRDKLVVIENYCKPQDEQAIRDAADKRFGRKQVLFLGELGKRKGGYDFARIIENALKKDPGIRFVFCGSGKAEDEQEIKKQVYEAAGQEKVLFPGWVRGKEKDGFLWDSAIYLLPSYNEGLPMSVLDAMAYGLPVVSTGIGGIPQLVDDGVSGVLAEPGDAEKMGAGIAGLLSDKGKYAAASLASYVIAGGKFSFDVHVKKLEEVYESVTGGE